MSKGSLALERAEKMYRELLCSSEKLPFAFTYGGKRYEGLPADAAFSQEKTDNGYDGVFSYSPDGMLAVSVRTRYCAEFGEME